MVTARSILGSNRLISFRPRSSLARHATLYGRHDLEPVPRRSELSRDRGAAGIASRDASRVIAVHLDHGAGEVVVVEKLFHHFHFGPDVRHSQRIYVRSDESPKRALISASSRKSDPDGPRIS